MNVSVLRQPPVTRLLLAGLISGIGDWLLVIALPVYVFAHTRPTLSSSTAMLIELGAALVAGQFAGVAVDRLDRRVVLAATAGAQALLLLPLLAVHGNGSLGIVYTVAGLQAALGTLAGPAENALLPSLVTDDDLMQANTVVGLASDMAKLIGAAAGGAALAAGGLSGVVLADTASFAAVVVLMAWRFPGAAPPPKRERLASPLGDWLEGLRVVRSERPLFAAVALIIANGLAQGIAFALVIAFIVVDVHRGSADIGVFRGVVVAGSLPTGVALATYGRRLAPEPLLKVSLLALTFVELAIWNGPSITHWFGYYLILQAVAGVPATAGFVSFITIIQRTTPAQYRGRVFGLITAASQVSLLLSVLLGGALGETFDPRDLLNVTVAMDLVTALAAIALFRRKPGGETATDAAS